jgi:hypothetical protein
VTVAIEGSRVTVKGPKGELSRTLPADIAVAQEGAELRVTRPSDEERHKAMHGLSRTLVANMVDGVPQGFPHCAHCGEKPTSGIREASTSYWAAQCWQEIRIGSRTNYSKFIISHEFSEFSARA